MMGREQTLPILGLIAVLALFGAACALPAGYYRGMYLEEGVAPYGWNLVLMGWMALPLYGLPVLSWFANPLLGLGLLRFWQRKYAAAARLSAVVVSLGLLPLAALAIDRPGAIRLWPNPAVMFSTSWSEVELRIGYFVWLAAQGLLLGFAVICWRRGRGTEAVQAEPDEQEQRIGPLCPDKIQRP